MCVFLLKLPLKYLIWRHSKDYLIGMNNKVRVNESGILVDNHTGEHRFDWNAIGFIAQDSRGNVLIHSPPRYLIVLPNRLFNSEENGQEFIRKTRLAQHNPWFRSKQYENPIALRSWEKMSGTNDPFKYDITFGLGIADIKTFWKHHLINNRLKNGWWLVI